MDKFTKLTGAACPINQANLNTDQILPARYLKWTRAMGIGKVLFQDLRFDADGNEKPDFPLNKPAWRNAKIVVGARNFGCGSSREAAVYALYDYGMRCVIAPSFGDIFSGNAVQNGLVTAIVTDEEAAEIMETLTRTPDLPVTVDLEQQTIVCGNKTYQFHHRPGAADAAAQRLGRHRADRKLPRPDCVVQDGRQEQTVLGDSGCGRMSNRAKVLIAGAGPVGLTAALLLGSKGIPVTLLEAEDAISEELRASTFHPPTLDMMAPFGITARMLDAGLVCPTWQIRLHPSGDRAVFDLSVLKGETDHPYRLQCEQAKYCQFVLDAVKKLPSVTVHFNAAVTRT